MGPASLDFDEFAAQPVVLGVRDLRLVAQVVEGVVTGDLGNEPVDAPFRLRAIDSRHDTSKPRGRFR